MTSAPTNKPATAGKNAADAVDETTGLRPSELATLRAKLEGERSLIRVRLQDHIGAINDGDRELPDEMDQASRDQDQGFLLRLADKERKLLLELDHALSKMDAGTYGLCEGTDEPIGFGRLSARPWARYGIAYKEELEREERDEKRER
jgi:DnaK suppressor protein